MHFNICSAAFTNTHSLYRQAIVLGATSIEKIPKISASGRNFLDPLPSSKKGPTDENDGISYLIVIIKFFFSSKFQPPHPPPFITLKHNKNHFFNFYKFYN